MVKPRPPQLTVKCVDTYCELYRDLFVEVRAYEAFKYLHVGIISEIKRKSLPAIAKAVGLKNEQGLLHFLTESPWKAEELETRRLEIILNILEGRETRYIREIIYGKRRKTQYWEITRDKENITPEGIWFVMTRIPQLKYQQVGEIYGVRTWIEYGFKQCKSELGWADFRVTHYEQIQKWWELIMSAYLMICLHSESFNPAIASISENFKNHELWDRGKGWKSLLKNMQLIFQPYLYFNFISKWLKIFPLPQLSLGFPRLIAKMNEVDCLHYLVHSWDDFCYSSA